MKDWVWAALVCAAIVALVTVAVREIYGNRPPDHVPCSRVVERRVVTVRIPGGILTPDASTRRPAVRLGDGAWWRSVSWRDDLALGDEQVECVERVVVDHRRRWCECECEVTP